MSTLSYLTVCGRIPNRSGCPACGARVTGVTPATPAAGLYCLPAAVPQGRRIFLAGRSVSPAAGFHCRRRTLRVGNQGWCTFPAGGGRAWGWLDLAGGRNSAYRVGAARRKDGPCQRVQPEVFPPKNSRSAPERTVPPGERKVTVPCTDKPPERVAPCGEAAVLRNDRHPASEKLNLTATTPGAQPLRPPDRQRAEPRTATTTRPAAGRHHRPSSQDAGAATPVTAAQPLSPTRPSIQPARREPFRDRSAGRDPERQRSSWTRSVQPPERCT